ncbi:SPW repeat protein [Kutzneria buriramensis]|uniref:SPW repeat-containing protein n=1 Tax=Kutzneria buriramensis TaxID=1045776 RepID=A0A3E0HAI5_9PSEU|nr:SPW repeat protein [Kutzneria buriramensis]REH41049.1 SPW repeat-containing protein [Kutzneria buriramensis]
MAKSWTRWQDWTEVVIGALVALSPIVVATSTAAAWTMIVLGVLVVLDGLWSLASPSMVAGEWVQIVLGVLLFVAPWVMSYTAMSGASWVSWVGGVLTVLAGAVAVPVANSAHRGLAGSH